MSVNDMLNDTNDFPELLQSFLQALFHGPLFKSSEANLTERMKSLGSDMVFSISNAKYLPAKQLALGLGLKSMVGSKEVLQILNKFGHSINYWIAEELETRMAEEISDLKA